MAHLPENKSAVRTGLSKKPEGNILYGMTVFFCRLKFASQSFLCLNKVNIKKKAVMTL